MSCVKTNKLTEDKEIIIKTMEVTTPELGPVGGSIGKNDSKREMDLTRETKQDYDVIRCYK